MNRLYLVRHAENPANLTKEFSYRRVDLSLTPKGVLQAKQTAEWFKGKTIHAIYSSPLKRAAETAGILAAESGLPVEVMEDLREVNVGDLEGQPVTPELWAYHDSIVADWLGGKPERRFPNGEDYAMLWKRTQAAFGKIVAGRRAENIIVVGHGGMFSFTLKDLCPGVDLNLLRATENHNCSITEIEIESRHGRLNGQLIAWARCDHLHGPAAELVSGFMKHDW
ncbi:MAG: histidine phosphatase family protein [Acidobacteriota bacterium]